MCYIITMMNEESIFRVTIATCWESGTTHNEFVKAYDEAHALRIANRLFGNDVIGVTFSCKDNFEKV